MRHDGRRRQADDEPRGEQACSTGDTQPGEHERGGHGGDQREEHEPAGIDGQRVAEVAVHDRVGQAGHPARRARHAGDGQQRAGQAEREAASRDGEGTDPGRGEGGETEPLGVVHRSDLHVRDPTRTTR